MMTECTKPNREPDISIPASGMRACVNVWIKENVFEIGKDNFHDSIISDAQRFTNPIEYLEHISKNHTSYYPTRAKVAIDFLIEIELGLHEQIR